ncbi:MAG: hypothetical protein MJK15_07515 [Colwellia sp.]|nr:hypothetical protein [Colwellia sp.]
MILVVKQGYEKNHGRYALKLWPEPIARNNYQRNIQIESSNTRYAEQSD